MYTKLKTTLLAFIISISVAMAQAPNVINYQGVAANSAGSALANQNIRVRLKIHNTTASGTIQYSEVRTLTTDATGLFNIQIGSAGAVSTTGTWAGITWDNGLKFLQVEMDPTGGTTYVNMGTQQLVSVPYAQFAKQAGALSSSATINPSQINAGGATAGQVLQFNGTSWIPAVLQQGGSLALPYIVADPNLVSFAITNNSLYAGSAIYGKTTSGNFNATGIRGETSSSGSNGVIGKANNATALGIKAENPSGTALKATSNAAYPSIVSDNTATNGVGVSATADYGTGVYAKSNYGTALEVDGKLKISGGNTTPGAGKVLTSNATGEATWQALSQAPKVSFRASGSNVSFPPSMYTTLNFMTEDYDNGNCYNPTTYRFTAPVSGVYHFSAHTGLVQSSSVYNMENVQIEMRRVRPGTTQVNIASNRSSVENLGSSGSRAHVSLDTDVFLQTGDQVYVVAFHNCTSSVNATTSSGSSINSTDYFTGHLVHAQ